MRISTYHISLKNYIKADVINTFDPSINSIVYPIQFLNMGKVNIF